MRYLKNILISPDSTIKEAIVAIDKGAMEVALVVDKDKRLEGVVTDGDIRRAILKNYGLDKEVSLIMNKTPVSINQKQAEHAFDLMREKTVKQVPVLDDNGRVVKIVLIEDLLKREKKQNTVVIMAGGLGQRLNPFTKRVPKPLLMVGNKPILETIIEQFNQYGFTNIHIALNYKADAIESYFHDGKYFGVNITYLNEKKKLGTAGALKLIEKTNDLPVIVINGDILTKINFTSLCEDHLKNKNDMTVCVNKKDFQVPYGIVNLDNDKIVSLKEKPVMQHFINAGIYVLHPDMLFLVPDNKFFDMTDLINLLLSKNKRVGSFPIMEYWLDIGQMFDYQTAIYDYLEVFDVNNDRKDRSDRIKKL